jgi:hypothetical protein
VLNIVLYFLSLNYSPKHHCFDEVSMATGNKESQYFVFQRFS